MESTASVWEDPRCPFRVEWEPGQLNKMRILAVDAFYAVPRGGIEIGGVLLGGVEGKVVRIESFVPMECEHLTGPSFVLSPKDETALKAQLAGLAGRTVGWFHSHTRSDIHLSASDTEVHNRFFPNPTQIAMVVRPTKIQPLQANYFFRGPGGAMIGGARAFSVEPIRSKPVAVALSPESFVIPDSVPAADPAESPAELAPKRSYLWLSVALLLVALGAIAFLTRALWMPK